MTAQPPAPGTLHGPPGPGNGHLDRPTAPIASVCTNPRHDHTTVTDGTGGILGTPVPMLCHGCDRPSFYDESTGGYHHDDPQAPACYLVRYPSTGNPCWLPIHPAALDRADLRTELSDLRDAWITVHATDGTGEAEIHGDLTAIARRHGYEPADDINLVVTDVHGNCWLIPVHDDTVHLIQQTPRHPHPTNVHTPTGPSAAGTV